jgi:hypothetical protein
MCNIQHLSTLLQYIYILLAIVNLAKEHDPHVLSILLTCPYIIFSHIHFSHKINVYSHLTVGIFKMYEHT